jgi:hypothetical protein
MRRTCGVLVSRRHAQQNWPAVPIKSRAPALAFAALLALAAGPLLRAQQPQFPALTEEQKRAMDAALPKQAPAQPKKPRKMLVSNLRLRDGKPAQGPDSTPFGNYVIEQMGKRTGAYEAVFSDDIEMFRPGSIGQFDAICFNNTGGVLFDDPELRESLLNFIAGGKGFVGIHDALATFVQYPVYDQWPAFGHMLGGTENGGHPWQAHEVLSIKIDDPQSPINSVFQGRGFDVTSQAFQLQEAGNLRERLHVLLSIDISKMSLEGRRIFPARKDDKDFPVSWTKPHGKGRVFYTTMGHNPHIFWQANLLEHFLAGIQYALGDLPADDTPSARQQ